MKHSIKKTDIAIYALYIALFKAYHIPEIVQQCIKIVLLIMVALYLLRHSTAKRLLNKAVPLCMSIILSGVISCCAGIIPMKSMLDGILHALCIYLICALMEHCERKNYESECVDCLYRITSVFCLISFVSILLNVNSGNKSEIKYFFGYKFMTSYYYIFWLTLYGMKYSKKIRARMRAKATYFLLTLLVLLICLWVDCATSMIAVIFILFWQIIPERLRNILERRSCAMIIVAAAGIMPFLMSVILENSFIRNLVQNVLGRRLSLTGRMPIYLELGKYISKRAWFGYGYGNTVIFQRFGYGNAQNGLLEHALLYGLVGVTLLFWTLWRCLKNHGKKSAAVEGWYTVFYALVIASVVEISFNYIFYMAVFALGYFRRDSGMKNVAGSTKTE